MSRWKHYKYYKKWDGKGNVNEANYESSLRPHPRCLPKSIEIGETLFQMMLLYTSKTPSEPFPFMGAIATSLLTQVPGGLGVLEVVLLSLLKGTVGDSVLASVLIFRLIYYVMPLLFGMVALVAHEIYGGAVEARIAKSSSLDLSNVSPQPSLSPQEND